MWLDLEHPDNRLVLRSLRAARPDAEPIAPPASAPDPYAGCGSHPDVVERVWDELGRELPADCRCLLFGGPALVLPRSGVIAVVCYGTSYCLRLPPDAVEEAQAAGACTVRRWTYCGQTDLRQTFGQDWVFGAWSAREADWCRAVYQRFEGST